MENRVIDDSVNSEVFDDRDLEPYPIRPQHINTESHFWDAFGHNETEVSALYVVRLCQAKGGWMPFTKAELDEVAREDFHFNRLWCLGADEIGRAHF